MSAVDTTDFPCMKSETTRPECKDQAMPLFEMISVGLIALPSSTFEAEGVPERAEAQLKIRPRALLKPAIQG